MNKKECIYKVSGMHCASCEILIEKKLLQFHGVKSVEASTGRGEVVIEYENDAPSAGKLNQIFSEDKYVFSKKEAGSDGYVINLDGAIKTLGVTFLVIFAYFALNRLGLGKYANVSATSSLPAFFIMGIIAGVSSCAALVGGIVLSMSKQWAELYADGTSTKKRMQPHIMFNVGRIISYAFFGMLLGALGSKLRVSLQFSSMLVLFVSVMMIFLAFQMLGVRAFRRFQFTMPKFITRRVADEKNFKGKYMPSLMGASTFFLPCGFTIAAQGIALISGSALQGALVLSLFALGTAPALLLIGLTSVKFSSRPHLFGQFAKVAGTVVLFFALYNINAQMNVLGWGGLNGIFGALKSQAQDNNLPKIVNGKQLVKMDASSRGYSPNYLRVRAGVPVRWEIRDTGTSGCTGAIISRLFKGAIELTPGTTSVKEFTPPNTPGKYRFSCWMGMVTGIIEVVDPSQKLSLAGVSAVNAATTDDVIPSGAKGCGGGGSGGGGCGGSGGGGCGGAK